MDILNELISKVIENIDVCYLFTFVFLAYLVKKEFGVWLNKITKFEWIPVYTVLIIATLTAVPFMIFTDITFSKVMLSYALGTSLHETIFTLVEDKVNKKSNE